MKNFVVRKSLPGQPTKLPNLLGWPLDLALETRSSCAFRQRKKGQATWRTYKQRSPLASDFGKLIGFQDSTEQPATVAAHVRPHRSNGCLVQCIKDPRKSCLSRRRGYSENIRANSTTLYWLYDCCESRRETKEYKNNENSKGKQHVSNLPRYNMILFYYLFSLTQEYEL